MGLWARLREFFRNERLLKHGRREVDRLFREKSELLKKTSLRAQHRARTQVQSVTLDPLRVTFTILRHPRPYSFSKQYHEVIETYVYHVDEGRIERWKGINLSVREGEDGKAPDSPFG